MYLSDKKTIVFITGAFIGHSCWDEWIIFFENKGYKTVAPPWLCKNDGAFDLRQKHPDSKIAAVRLNSLLDYYTEIIEKLPEKPILIGHSYGGLLTQLLIQKDLGSIGICIHSLPPSNLISYRLFPFYRAILKSLGYFTTKEQTYLMSFKEWQHYFTTQSSPEKQKITYEMLAIPESKLLMRDIFSKSAKINFRKRHPPILFVSGSGDVFTCSLIHYLNFRKYRNIHSITCYKEFRDTNHLVLKHDDWLLIAEFIANWLEKIS